MDSFLNKNEPVFVQTSYPYDRTTLDVFIPTGAGELTLVRIYPTEFIPNIVTNVCDIKAKITAAGLLR